MLHVMVSEHLCQMHLPLRCVETDHLGVVSHEHSWAKRHLVGEMALPESES